MKWTVVVIVALTLTLAALLLSAGGCEPKPQPKRVTDGTPRVRVRLLAGVTRVTLAVDRPTALVGDRQRAFNINSPISKQLGMLVQPDHPLDLAYDGQSWLNNGHRLGDDTFYRIDPGADGTVTVNGLPYRGSCTIYGIAPGKIDVVNELDVEDYLRGVLAKELLADWHPEAYRAQAVIARTYALYEAKTNPPGRSWDLNPDTSSQVYGGMKAETSKATAAVLATRGVVAAYGPTGQERIFKAYFSSCCGGVSSSAADVFNEPAIPPLSAKSTGVLCSISPRFTWPTVTLTKVELCRRFRAWGAKQGRPEAKMPGLQTITIGTVNAFGRPRTFLLTDTSGQQYALTAEQLRWAINTDPAGGPTVFSGYFRPVDTGDSIRLADGHGFGHGVGACQWCMQARALNGEDYRRIVMQAFPQAVLVQAF